MTAAKPPALTSEQVAARWRAAMIHQGVIVPATADYVPAEAEVDRSAESTQRAREDLIARGVLKPWPGR